MKENDNFSAPNNQGFPEKIASQLQQLQLQNPTHQQPRIPLTEQPTLGQALAEGNTNEKKYVHAFLQLLAQNPRTKEYEDRDSRRKRKKKRKEESGRKSKKGKHKKRKKKNCPQESEEKAEPLESKRIASPVGGGSIGDIEAELAREEEEYKPQKSAAGKKENVNYQKGEDSASEPDGLSPGPILAPPRDSGSCRISPPGNHNYSHQQNHSKRILPVNTAAVKRGISKSQNSNDNHNRYVHSQIPASGLSRSGDGILASPSTGQRSFFISPGEDQHQPRMNMALNSVQQYQHSLPQVPMQPQHQSRQQSTSLFWETPTHGLQPFPVSQQPHFQPVPLPSGGLMDHQQHQEQNLHNVMQDPFLERYLHNNELEELMLLPPPGLSHQQQSSIIPCEESDEVMPTDPNGPQFSRETTDSFISELLNNWHDSGGLLPHQQPHPFS